MSTRPAPAKIQVAFALQAPIAVIVRRGPTNWSQLVLWKTDLDRFTPGQWVQGRVAFAELSPNGKHLALGIRAKKQKEGGCFEYTLISRPPYFAALAISFNYLQTSDIAFTGSDSLEWQTYGGISWRAENECPYTRGVNWETLTHSAAQSRVIFPGASHWESPAGRQFHAKDGVLYEGDRILLDLNQYQPTEVQTPEWAKEW